MKTGLRVFTAQYDYNREERVDTTVKTAHKEGYGFLMPSWEIVLGHKGGKISDEEYTQQYLHMLDVSMQQNPEQWIALLRRRKVVLVCFCGRECFCHRHILALWLTKLGARYMGEFNNKTGVLIPADRHMPKCLNAGTQQMIKDYEPAKKSDTASTMSSAMSGSEGQTTRKMVVDPLTVNTVQSSICRNCRDNRTAMAWTPKGNITQSLYSEQVDEELNSRTLNCCSMQFDENAVPTYKCPIFQQLIDGYFAGVTSQGTNINPCKHCTDFVDNGGKCFGDRCKDGPFPIKEGAGLVKC